MLTVCVAYSVSPVLSNSLWLMGCRPPGSSVHGILQEEYWSGLSCPPTGDLPDPGTEPISLLSPASVAGFFTTSANLASQVKKLPANAGDVRDTGSISGSGRSLEKDMATYSSILSWRIPWTEEPGRLQPIGSQRVDVTECTHTHQKYIQYPVTNHNEKEYEKECIYVYNWITLLYSRNTTL